MNKKLLGYVVLIVIIIWGGVAWNRDRTSGIDVTQTAPNAVTVNDKASTAGTISYNGVEGQTALALLKASHSVETKSFSFGEMVTSVDGQAAVDGVNFWEFLVNGEQATVGAGEYQTKATDKIEWRLSTINAQ